MSEHEALRIKKMLEENHRVIIHGLPGMGKTYLALKMSAYFKVCVHFDCEVDYPYFEEMLKAHRQGQQAFAELLIGYGDVDPFFYDDILFVFDNIESSQIFYRQIFPIFRQYDFKLLMTMRVKNKSLREITECSEIYTLRPFSYKAFFQGCEGSWPEDIISGHIAAGKEVPTIIHQNCIRILEDYIVTGGIPEARNCYLKAENPEESIKSVHEKYKYYVFEKLLECADISDTCKYQCRQIVDSLISQMLEENYSKFIVSRIREGVTFQKYKEAIDFLVDNNFLLKTPEESKTNCFKLFFYDCGMTFDLLLQRSNRQNVYRDFDAVSEVVYQNFLIQELTGEGILPTYWKSRYTAVVDAVFPCGERSFACKVFSDDDLRDKSLTEYKKAHPEAYLIKVSPDNLKQSENFFYLPLYAISCMGNENFQKLFLNVVERKNIVRKDGKKTT